MMSRVTAQTNLETMKYYQDSQIVCTFCKGQMVILSVRYLKDSQRFELTYNENLVVETYSDLDAALSAIEFATI